METEPTPEASIACWNKWDQNYLYGQWHNCLPCCRRQSYQGSCWSECHRHCPKWKVNGRPNQADIPPNGVRFLITSVIQALVWCLSCRVAPGYIIHTCGCTTSTAFRWHFVAGHCLCGRQWQWLVSASIQVDFSTVCPARSKAQLANETRSSGLL